MMTLQEARRRALIKKANKLLDRIESNLQLIVNYSKAKEKQEYKKVA